MEDRLPVFHTPVSRQIHWPRDSDTSNLGNNAMTETSSTGSREPREPPAAVTAVSHPGANPLPSAGRNSHTLVWLNAPPADPRDRVANEAAT